MIAGTQAGTFDTATAIAGKSLRTFVRDPQAVFPTLLQGVLFLLVFRYVFAGAIEAGPLAYVDYMGAGIITATILFGATQAAVTVARERTAGFTDRVLSLPTRRVGVTLGRITAHAVIVAAAASTTLVAAVLVGFRTHAPAVHLALAAGLLLAYAVAFAALFVALGTVAASPEAAQGLAFSAIPLTFLSSAIIPTATMPGWLAVVADHQPLTPMIDALRSLAASEVLGADSGAVVTALTWAVVITLVSVVVATRRLRASASAS